MQVNLVGMHPDEFFDRFLYDSGPSDERTAGALVRGPVADWNLWWRVQARCLADQHPDFAPALRQGFVMRTNQVTRPLAPIVRRNVRSASWCAPQPRTRTVVDPAVEGDTGVPDRFEIARRQHALACAAAAAVNRGFVVSGRSAAILHGLPTVTVPDRPQLTASTRLNSHRRGKAGITRAEVVRWFGVPVLSPARTVVDVARADRREGIVVADAALRERLVDGSALDAALDRASGWCGVRSARETVALADALAESPLESLTRLALHDDAFPRPQLQVEFEIPGLRVPYRVDLYWPQYRLVLECDGRLKCDRDRRWKEKRRTIALERSGNRVEHVVWTDVWHDWARTSSYLRTRLG